jgi:hypothetical protein
MNRQYCPEGTRKDAKSEREEFKWILLSRSWRPWRLGGFEIVPKARR